MEHFWVKTIQRGKYDVCVNKAGPFTENTAAIIAHRTEVKLPESGEFYVQVVNSSDNNETS